MHAWPGSNYLTCAVRDLQLVPHGQRGALLSHFPALHFHCTSANTGQSRAGALAHALTRAMRPRALTFALGEMQRAPGGHRGTPLSQHPGTLPLTRPLTRAVCHVTFNSCSVYHETIVKHYHSNALPSVPSRADTSSDTCRVPRALRARLTCSVYHETIVEHFHRTVMDLTNEKSTGGVGRGG